MNLYYIHYFPQIMMSQMHLTGLANVSIDNPTKVTSEQITESVMNFLDTDTVLFFSDVRIESHTLDDGVILFKTI